MRALLLACALLLSLPVFAASTPWEKADHSEIRLVSGGFLDGAHRVGLHLKMEEGWKTYWRTPGDAGLPFAVSTDGSENLQSAQILWPAPRRSVDYGEIESFGYKHEVVIPFPVVPTDPAAPTLLKAEVKYAICKEICLFVDKTLTLPLDPSVLASEEDSELMRQALDSLPRPLADSGITATAPMLDADAGKLSLTLTGPNPFTNSDVLIELSPSFRFAKPEILEMDGGRSIKVIAPAQVLVSDQVLPGKQVTLTLVSDDAPAYEWQAAIGQAESYGSSHLLLMLGFALLGGFILNLMPCVLPVLSLKILGVLKKTGKADRVVRTGFLASALGIVVSFLLLAAIVVALKMAGVSVGWGFQFQEPYFIIGLCILLTVFTANMFGLFELQLPERLNQWMYHRTAGENYLAHFLTGAFATLMATPCSAPFLGTAIGFAFSEGALMTFALFFAMGVGLALPYLLIALFPALVKRMPKPGPWMARVKLALGLMLVATIIWLLSVLAGQAEWRLAIMIGFALAILFTYFVLRPNMSNASLRLGLGIAILGVILLLPVLVASPKGQSEITSGSVWQPFDRPSIAKLVSEGKVVMVDVTADWCLTCKANKLFVLDSSEIKEKLASEHIVAMRADWTNRDLAIAEYLKSFGRYGIPFNVVYGPKAPEGIPLPELLTKSLVTDAIEKAK